MNCWDIKRCSPEVKMKCPAYPDRGMDCWKVTGTKCEQGKYEMATLKEKIAYCCKCSFYQQYANKY